jgi:hypothetical protein
MKKTLLMLTVAIMSLNFAMVQKAYTQEARAIKRSHSSIATTGIYTGTKPGKNTGLTVTYDPIKGCGTFYMNENPIKTHCNWSNSWHSIILLNGTLDRDFWKVVFYNKSAGVGAIYKVDKNGNMSELKVYSNWSKTWDKLDFYMGGVRFMQADGYCEVYYFQDDGKMDLIGKKNN